MARLSPFSLAATATVVCALCACSPAYDWREVRGADAPYSILLPAKPVSHTRPVTLDGIQVAMTMTVAEADGVTFAVGSAEFPDANRAAAALLAMKTALSRNAGGTTRRESTAAGNAATPIDLEILGGPDTNGTQPRLLIARFLAKDRRAYQLVVVGKEKAMSREAVDTFLASFKPA